MVKNTNIVKLVGKNIYIEGADILDIAKVCKGYRFDKLQKFERINIKKEFGEVK